MSDRTSHSAPHADDLRRVVALCALVVGVVAVVFDPGPALDVVFAAVAVAAFAAWAFVPGVALVVLTVVVVAAVVLAQRTGELEPLFFEVSLLALVVGRWSRSLPAAIALGALAALSPLFVGAIQSPSQIAVISWILGIAFPWAVARVLARQEQLAAQLEATRRQLAEQALLEERRRIAREVHDFVGHGLAAVMLQITSARHVLRRDPAAAEEALSSAEQVGRRSMQELRRTVALLRSDDDAGVAPPLPSAGEIHALVDDARESGLAVELRMRGDLSGIAPGVGVALYRIAQETLANAARHAPRARTRLALELADGDVRFVADSVGPLASATDAERRVGYGLVGMRERAAALGGELTAGPIDEGWRVACRLPSQLDEMPAS